MARQRTCVCIALRNHPIVTLIDKSAVPPWQTCHSSNAALVLDLHWRSMLFSSTYSTMNVSDVG